MPYKDAAAKRAWKEKNFAKQAEYRYRHAAKRLGVTVDELLAKREERKTVELILLERRRLAEEERRRLAEEERKRLEEERDARRRRHMERKSELFAPRRCDQCGESFVPKAPNQRFCSSRHRDKWRWDNDPEYRSQQLAKSKERGKRVDVRAKENEALRLKRAARRAAVVCRQCGLPLGDDHARKQLHRECSRIRQRRLKSSRARERYRNLTSEERAALNKASAARHRERMRTDPDYRAAYRNYVFRRHNDPAYRESRMRWYRNYLRNQKAKDPEGFKQKASERQRKYRGRKLIQDLINIAPTLKEKLNDRNTGTFCPDRL